MKNFTASSLLAFFASTAAFAAVSTLSLTDASRLVAATLTQSHYSGTTSNGTPCTVDVSIQSSGVYQVTVDARTNTDPTAAWDYVDVGMDGTKLLQIENRTDSSEKLSLTAKIRYPGGGDLGPSSVGEVSLTVSNDDTVTVKNHNDEAVSCKI